MFRIPGSILLLSLLTNLVWAYTINDGHMHYNQDVWSQLSPQQALKWMTENGIERAIVSSTPNAGTLKLYREAPQRIIPFLRPYRIYRDRFIWHSDPGIVEYISEQLKTGSYRGFGEFHLFRQHKNTLVVDQLMKLMVEHGLAVSAHTDAETIVHLITKHSDLKLIWAHCGMDHPVEDVRIIMETHPQLQCELSFRYNMLDDEQKLLPSWKYLLETYPQRFMLGMDTYIPRRWAHLPEHIDYAKHWLAQLSEPARKLIAHDNIINMFPPAD